MNRALFSLVLTLCFCFCTADKECSIKRMGKLSMFSDHQHVLEMPCKFRMADFQCGNARVVVTGQSEQDRSRFTPGWVKVKVVDLQSNKEFQALTDSTRLQEAINDPRSENPWTGGTGGLTGVGTRYNAGTKAAVLEFQNVKVTFKEKGSSEDDAGIVVKCQGNDFTSQPLSHALCGDGVTDDPVRRYRIDEFGCGSSLTYSDVLQYLILSDTIMQSGTTCQGINERFNTCKYKELAVKSCDEIFGNQKLASCLADSPTPLMQYYDSCLRQVCDNDKTATVDLRSYYQKNCNNVTANIPDGVC